MVFDLALDVEDEAAQDVEALVLEDVDDCDPLFVGFDHEVVVFGVLAEVDAFLFVRFEFEF